MIIWNTAFNVSKYQRKRGKSRVPARPECGRAWWGRCWASQWPRAAASHRWSLHPRCAAGCWSRPSARVANKKPTQKNPKNPLKVFFSFLIFYENNTNFSLWNRFFMNKWDIKYYLFTKNSKACTQLWIFSERKKIDTQSRADAYIRRKRLISKSDYNLKSGCT